MTTFDKIRISTVNDGTSVGGIKKNYDTLPVKIVDKKIKVRNSGSWVDLETFLKIKDQEP